jgi:hypothetical protein
VRRTRGYVEWRRMDSVIFDNFKLQFDIRHLKTRTQGSKKGETYGGMGARRMLEVNFFGSFVS